MGEKRIEILEDVNGVIKFEEIKEDVVNRSEVEAVKARLAELKAAKVAIEEEEKELHEKIAYAEQVIAIADAKKLAEESVVSEEVAEEVAE